jgi:hypothetical protein
LWLALFYHCMRNGPMFAFFAYVATLTHIEAHDPCGFYNEKFSFLNRYMEYGLSFFYGHVPANYRIGHNKIHHMQPVNGDHGESPIFHLCFSTIRLLMLLCYVRYDMYPGYSSRLYLVIR